MVLKLFNLDLHISVIEDITYIAKKLFQDNIEITNWSISGHNNIFNKIPPPFTPINQETWKNISPELVHHFQKIFDAELSSYDGFIVTHTPVFCMLYEKYKKPILCVNTCRFDQPFCWAETSSQTNRQWMIDGLRRMIDAKQLYIVSNNKADYTYLLEGAGISSMIIPSLCLYTNECYTPDPKKPFVLHGDRSKVPPNDLLVAKPPNHTWKELYEYQGIVHMPYEMSTMSIFEQVFAGVPLWFPTPEFYIKSIVDGTMEFISPYDKWNTGVTGEDIFHWLKGADFYIFPHVNHYDSWEDLFQQLSSFQDTKKDARLEWTDSVKKGVLEVWENIFKALFPELSQFGN